MAEITVTLPAEMQLWRSTVFPGFRLYLDGSPTGCTCPWQKQWPGTLVFEDTCPVHTEEIRNGWIKIANAEVR